MIRPKTVLFDLGKVLVDFDYQIAANRLAPLCQCAPADVIFRVFGPLLLRYESGGMSNEVFFEEARHLTGYRGDFATFAECFGDVFWEIPAMIELHARLRAARVPVWIFSNTNDLAIALIRRRFPFFSQFDGYFLSYQIGAMKPHPRIYEAAEQTTGCRGSEILYLDDRAENVAAGAARGWQIIEHRDPAETIPFVEALCGLKT